MGDGGEMTYHLIKVLLLFIEVNISDLRYLECMTLPALDLSLYLTKSDHARRVME